MTNEMRMARVGEALGERDLDALLVTNLTNVRYLTGFSGTNAQLLVTASGDATFFSDPRYEQRAAALVQGADISIYAGRRSATDWSGSPAEALAAVLPSAPVRLGVEGATMTVAESASLAACLPVEVEVTENVVEDLRRVKDDAEMKAIAAAVEVSDAAFHHLIGTVRPGMTESEVALEAEIFMRRSGAESVSFPPIVGSGPLSAHIHHTPSDRPLATGDLLLIDMGALVDGYCSDLTRTVVLGASTAEQRDMYAIVLAAQAAGIQALGHDVGGREVDAAARKVIEDAGSGDRFGHGLGHGVGLDIHESPNLSRLSEDVLRAGEVVTVEPGIYTPGLGGIRIEDCVAVTADGSEVLGGAPKESLLEI